MRLQQVFQGTRQSRRVTMSLQVGLCQQATHAEPLRTVVRSVLVRSMNKLVVQTGVVIVAVTFANCAFLDYVL